RDVAQEFEVEPVEQRLVPGMPRIDLQQRIAIRRRLHDRLGGDIASCSRPVLDHEGLPESIRQPLGERARDDIGRRARRKADDDAHWSRRIGLRPCEARDRRQRGSAGGEMQKLSSVGKFHGPLPECKAAINRGQRRARRRRLSQKPLQCSPADGISAAAETSGSSACPAGGSPRGYITLAYWRKRPRLTLLTTTWTRRANPINPV